MEPFFITVCLIVFALLVEIVRGYEAEKGLEHYESVCLELDATLAENQDLKDHIRTIKDAKRKKPDVDNTAEIDDLKSENRKLKAELEKVKASRHQHLKNAVDAVRKMGQRLFKAKCSRDREVSDLEMRKDSMIRIIDAKDEEIESLKVENKDLKAKVNEVDAENKALLANVEEIKDAREREVAALLNKMDEMGESIMRLYSEKWAVGSRIRDLEEKRKSEVEQLEVEVKDLKDKLEGFDATREKLGEMARENSRLRREKEEMVLVIRDQNKAVTSSIKKMKEIVTAPLFNKEEVDTLQEGEKAKVLDEMSQDKLTKELADKLNRAEQDLAQVTNEAEGEGTNEDGMEQEKTAFGTDHVPEMDEDRSTAVQLEFPEATEQDKQRRIDDLLSARHPRQAEINHIWSLNLSVEESVRLLRQRGLVEEVGVNGVW